MTSTNDTFPAHDPFAPSCGCFNCRPTIPDDHADDPVTMPEGVLDSLSPERAQAVRDAAVAARRHLADYRTDCLCDSCRRHRKILRMAMTAHDHRALAQDAQRRSRLFFMAAVFSSVPHVADGYRRAQRVNDLATIHHGAHSTATYAQGFEDES